MIRVAAWLTIFCCAAQAAAQSKPFGSGRFGAWIDDEWGLPAYRYTCEQAADPAAATRTNPAYRSATDHTHQVGNDRLVAAVSNYGYVQVRQDEGAPKFLNDFYPPEHQFGGGFGYLVDGNDVLSTYYDPEADSFERVFGAGYYRKTAASREYSVDETLLAPFGDDPILITRVRVRNLTDRPADVRWIQYWGCQQYQFSFLPIVRSTAARDFAVAPPARRELAKRFQHRFEPSPDGDGIIEQSVLSVPAAPPAHRVPAFDDLAPPSTFLVSLNGAPSAATTDAAAFFGNGSALAPEHAAQPITPTLDTPRSSACMLLERSLHLEPNASTILYFAYGYLPDGVKLDALLAKYQHDPDAAFASSARAWKSSGLKFEVPGQPWVAREMLWNHYYLRSNLTYDDFFGEHILSQGHVYQYTYGFQGAARDPLQHAMPFIFSDPWIVKSILRYTLKEVQADGEIPYGIVGSGMTMPVPFRPSDQEMWLLWLASEYVLATRDIAFLEESLPTYPLYGPNASHATVRELLERCYRHFVDTTGTGNFGLQRLSNGDWNDSVLWHIPEDDREGIQEQSVSVLNAAMATYTLDLYGEMLMYIGENALARDARQHAEAQRLAVREQWTGEWFRRAWFTPRHGWVGEDQLWLEPQPWAIIGGAATPEQTSILVNAINREVRDGEPIGARLQSRGVGRRVTSSGEFEVSGMGTSGGVWPSINGTLVWALARVDGQLGWNEWRKNTLAWHAENYPDIWYGIWSGPDTWNSSLAGDRAGQTVCFPPTIAEDGREVFQSMNWTDFPVMNMHPHAWPLYSAAKLMGIEFNRDGVEIRPALPLPEYRFASPLIGVEKNADGYRGWYEPMIDGTWTLTINPQNESAAGFRIAEINDSNGTAAPAADGSVAITGFGGPGHPLRWKLLR